MKKILNILLVLLIVASPLTVMAESGEIDVKPVDEIGDTSTSETTVTTPTTTSELYPNSSIKDQYNEIDNVMEADVSLTDISNKIDRKLWEIAGILQRWSIPISVATFIIGCFLMILGALSKRGGIAPGLITCGTSILVYTLCTNAPTIIVAVSNWFMN